MVLFEIISILSYKNLSLLIFRAKPIKNFIDFAHNVCLYNEIEYFCRSAVAQNITTMDNLFN